MLLGSLLEKSSGAQDEMCSTFPSPAVKVIKHVTDTEPLPRTEYVSFASLHSCPRFWPPVAFTFVCHLLDLFLAEGDDSTINSYRRLALFSCHCDFQN